MSEDNEEKNDKGENEELLSTGALRDAKKKRVSIEDVINNKENK
jgi:hypothetical protein